MSALRARWQKEQFDPGWLGWLVNPFVIARGGLRRELGELLPRLSGDVVDVGCGTGALTSRLAELVGSENVAAADPSAPFVEQCRANVPGADVRVGSRSSPRSN